jgi:hypothetical protein
MLAGCGGISTGDYVLYKVALNALPKKSAGCFGPDGPDPNTRFDTDDGVGVATWVITAAPNDEWVLNTGKASLSGQKADSGYDFHETKVDVTYDGDTLTSNTKHTDTDAVDIPVTLSGDDISGTITEKLTHKCAGTNCPVDGIPSCTITTDFTGSEIDDVTLYHDPAAP